MFSTTRQNCTKRFELFKKWLVFKNIPNVVLENDEHAIVNLGNSFSLSVLFSYTVTWNKRYAETLLKYKDQPIYVKELEYEDVQRFMDKESLEDHIVTMLALFKLPIIKEIMKNPKEKVRCLELFKIRRGILENFLDLFEKSEISEEWYDHGSDGLVFYAPLKGGYKLIADFSNFTDQKSICVMSIKPNIVVSKLTDTDYLARNEEELLKKLIVIKNIFDNGKIDSANINIF